MVDLLSNRSRPEAGVGRWIDAVESLNRRMAELEATVASLRRENLELRQQAGYHKTMHARALERLEAQKRINEELRGEVRLLRSGQFGRKTEKRSKADRSNKLEGLDDDLPGEGRTAAKGKPGPKRRGLGHLPVREEIIELPAGRLCCPGCGKPRLPMAAFEDSEQVEIEVKAHRRRIRRRRYRAGCDCPGPRTITAPAPPKLVPKSRLGTSVWVELLLAKYRDHQPAGRLLSSWETFGLDLPASTVNGGLERLAPLFEPVYEALRERNRRSKYRRADETRWLVFAVKDGKTGYRWWLWVFAGEDTVVYVLDPFRSHDVPEKYFPKDVPGVLTVDRLVSYKIMEQVRKGLIVLAFCWAHVRRDFIRVAKSFPELKPWALEWLRLVRDAYHCNNARLPRMKGKEPVAAEDARLRAIVEGMKAKAAGQLADADLRTACRKVLESLQNHWDGLTRFVDDPRIPMDNNASERDLRGPALGRKNYYGSFAEWSGRLATSLFSIFATLKMAKVNPRTWLRTYLDACAANGGKPPDDIDAYLPWKMDEGRLAGMRKPLPFGPGQVPADSS